MADVSKVFKPRRGTSTVMAGTKKSTVLAAGEFFLEMPSGGAGKGACKVKIGDGTTAYSSLPYALGDTSNDKITFSSNTSTTVATALNSVVSGASLKNIVGGLKQAISLCNTSITQLNDDIDSFQTGVDLICNACTNYGSTPKSKNPGDIVNAITDVCNIFRVHGQNDVKSNPNGFGFYTQDQYVAYYNSGRGQGQADVVANPAGWGLYTGQQYTNYGTQCWNNGYREAKANCKAMIFTSPVYMSNYTTSWASLTAADFKAGASYASAQSDSHGACFGGAAVNVTPTFSYDPASSLLNWTTPLSAHRANGKYENSISVNVFVIWLGTVGGQ